MLKRFLDYLYQTRERGLTFKNGEFEFLTNKDESFNRDENGRESSTRPQ
jgi:hypothetical protein